MLFRICDTDYIPNSNKQHEKFASLKGKKQFDVNVDVDVMLIISQTRKHVRLSPHDLIGNTIFNSITVMTKCRYAQRLIGKVQEKGGSIYRNVILRASGNVNHSVDGAH